MANKPFNTRIQLKHDTEAHWELATGFSPKAGELIIYDVDATHSSPRFKVGDGTTNVNELPFVVFDYSETDPTVPAWAKATTKPTYTAQEVGALPNSTVIPTKTSDLTNDSGFLTAHQDISGKADKNATVSNVAYDTTNKKITKTINGTTSDVISAATLKTDMSLSNVENKSSATIRGEITSKNVTDALGFTPTSNTGTVTSVATGVGLTGGTITGSGTIKAKLKSETALTNDSAAATETSGRVYPIAIDKSGYLAVNVPWTDSKPVTSVAGKTGAVTLAKGDVGLGNVDNKSSATIRNEITSSNVTTALGFTPLDASLKGANSGIAELDSNGKVPSSQLPSYVDDVLEYIAKTGFPSTGETGKIYVDTATNKTYRWSGSDYVEISASLALGTTSSTAYRGDYGNAAYTHAVTNKGSAFSSGLYKITTNSEGHVTGATAVAKSDITGLGIPGENTDTKVTAVGNHYTPAEDTSAKLSVDASSSTAATWNSTSLVTGVDIKRDAKGHVVGVAVDSIKMPANPNSDTHRVIQVNGTQALASNTTALNLKAGSNVTITDGGSGAITIAATDTKYTAATAAPGSIATSGSQGSSTNYARQDHTHGISLATGDSNGQVKIAGSNVSVKGLGSAAYTNSTAYAAASHTHSGDAISGGYLNIHPENGPVLIPFMNNDIAYLLKRGGSAVVKYDGTTQSIDLTNIFDASPSYLAINPSGITTITIELSLHKTFNWTNIIYVDFGASSWRSTTVKIEVMNSNYSSDAWSQKYNNTSNSSGHCYVTTGHTPTGASNAGGGFNKIRFTFSGWGNSSNFRIAQIGVYNYGSAGLRETFLPRDGGALYGSIYPNSNNGANLGTTSQYFSNAYITNINGVAVGSSPKFTDTNTWRGIQNNLTSDSTTDSLSAAQGKALKALVDSKTSNTGTVTSVAAGTGLSGGTITTSGTLSVSYGSTAGTACQGNDSRLSDSRNAKDVYSWAKASTKPSYTYSEVGAMQAPLFITTSNTSASDALTYGTATTLSTGRLVFVTLNKAMAGSANATLKFGSNTAINIYLTGTTQLKAKYAAGTMLGLVYNGTNLYMINPPAAV